MNEFSAENYEKIEDYLANRLTSTELSEFQNELTSNTTLKEEVVKVELLRRITERQKTRNTIQSIRAKLLTEVDEELELEEKLPELPKKQMNILWKVPQFAAAASIAFVLFLNFTSFDLPDETLLSMRGMDTENRKMGMYNTYLDAQISLRKGNNQKAAQLFEIVSNSTDKRPYFKEASEWYRAVALIDTEPYTSEKLIKSLNKIDAPHFEINWLERSKAFVKIQFSKVKISLRNS